MAISLVVEVLDHAPANLTPAERLVLVVLAESANEITRKAWPGLATLSRRTGLKPDSLRRVFQRLATNGIEVRETTTTADGKQEVVAHSGHRTVYVIPKLARRDEDPALKAGRQSHLPEEKAGRQSEKGGTVVRERRDADPGKAGPQSPPSPQEPSKNPQSLSSTARDSALTRESLPIEREEKNFDLDKEPIPQRLFFQLGATRNEAEMLTYTKTKKHQPQSNAFWRKVYDNGDMAAWIAGYRRNNSEDNVA